MSHLKGIQLAFQNTKAVLFDMDGVITDTMPRHCFAWKKALLDMAGVDIPDQEIYRREGEKSHTSVPLILEKYGVTSTAELSEKIVQYKAKVFSETPATEPLFFEGVLDFIQEVASQKKIALVTGSQRKEVNALLSLGLRNQFSSIITCDDVTQGKPSPEPYAKAASKIGLDATETLVIENAPLGIQSGKTAGAIVVAITTSCSKEFLSDADYIFESHQSIYQSFI